MGFYDKADAKTTYQDVWFDPERYDFKHCYNAAEAFEQAIFDLSTEQPVGKVQHGFTTFPPQHLKSFGLGYRVRRVADVDTLIQNRIAKRQRDAEDREKAKARRSVTTLTFDTDWHLREKTVETRMVYTNKSGGMVIKTRSNGSPTVHEVDGNYVVVYYPHRWVTRGGDVRYTVKAAKVLPDNCPVLDNV